MQPRTRRISSNRMCRGAFDRSITVFRAYAMLSEDAAAATAAATAAAIYAAVIVVAGIFASASLTVQTR